MTVWYSILVIVFYAGNSSGGIYAVQIEMPSTAVCKRERDRIVAEKVDDLPRRAAYCVDRQPSITKYP